MTEEDKAPEQKAQEPKKSLPMLEETRAMIDEMKKEKEEMQQIKDELQELRSEQLLSGTGGARVEPEKPKPLTPKEYAEQLRKGIVPKDY